MVATEVAMSPHQFLLYATKSIIRIRWILTISLQILLHVKVQIAAIANVKTNLGIREVGTGVFTGPTPLGPESRLRLCVMILHLPEQENTGVFHPFRKFTIKALMGAIGANTLRLYLIVFVTSVGNQYLTHKAKAMSMHVVFTRFAVCLEMTSAAKI
jgi:hypothetical protein